MNLPDRSVLSQYADLPIRLVTGFHLIYGTQDNVFSYTRMLEFCDFLEQFGTPLPLLAAHVSVYAQFLSGILFIIGLKVRIAAVLMILNFIVAILLVHIGDSYPSTFPALTMLAGSCYLFMNGAGRISLDQKALKKG